MKVLVTGTDGYLGCMLAPVLAQRGHEVTGLDTGYYKYGWLYNGLDFQPHTIVKDIRDVTTDDLRGFDAVIQLAELSNDPLGQLAPNITYDINHVGSVNMAKCAKEAGVGRFVYFSSCSVYGASSTRFSDEETPAEPLTAYAKCKTLVENDVRELADDNFSPAFMRNATAHGASPRQRFDLVVNNLAGVAYTTKVIKMDSDGTPWRPLVHVLDICQAAALIAEAPREKVHNQTFNIGANDENYQVKDIARIVADTFPGCELSIGTRGGDRRDYKVSFDKLHNTFPEYKTQMTVPQSVDQLRRIFEQIRLDEERFNGRGHVRLKQIEYLIGTGQVNVDLFWQTPA